uniref:Bridging integrator 3 n=1 Tax=Pavo cristatus TaxID=9049 RepID=A0A8C9G1Q5_PAVCR
LSWIPFKIGQPKKQIVPKTVERDFEREYGKLQQLEEQTKKLQKDMKKSTDADLAMSKSAVKISSDLLSNPLCEQDAAFLEVVTAFDTAMRRMDSFNQEKVGTALGPRRRSFWGPRCHSLWGLRRHALWGPKCRGPSSWGPHCRTPWDPRRLALWGSRRRGL